MTETLADPERELALSYAKSANRPYLRALWAVDERFGAIVAGTTEAAIGEMRLLWWREALGDPAEHATGEPLLAQVATCLTRTSGDGAEWGRMAEGWFALLQEPLAATELERFANERGGRLFRLSAELLAGETPDWISDHGRIWALSDLASRIRDADVAAQARSIAADILATIPRRKWPRTLRPIGAIATLARRDTLSANRRQGSPARIIRMIYHNITGN